MIGIGVFGVLRINRCIENSCDCGGKIGART